MVSGGRSPSYRWSCEHGGRLRDDGTRRKKIAWRWKWLARRHARRVSREVYACCWGEHYLDGETARKHWHVGRAPSYRKQVVKPKR